MKCFILFGLFRPPHLIKVGQESWLAKKYGQLDKLTWREDLKAGFSECFRILKTNGTLIFKWNETDIPVKDILLLTEYKPSLATLAVNAPIHTGYRLLNKNLGNDNDQTIKTLPVLC